MTFTRGTVVIVVNKNIMPDVEQNPFPERSATLERIMENANSALRHGSDPAEILATSLCAAYNSGYQFAASLSVDQMAANMAEHDENWQVSYGRGD